MKIVICPDSFKGSISSLDACKAIEKGIKKVFSDIEIVSIPLADGGEGTIDTISKNIKLEKIKVKVLNPIGEEIESYYALTENNIAIIEMSLASGITLISEEKRNPLNTTTYGVGQLIKEAVKNNCEKIIIGLGGSATSDCGVGALQSLGFEFYDSQKKLITNTINNQKLQEIENISIKNVDKKILETEIILACDVKNILLGSHGAVYTYALQKGAKKEELPILEKNIELFIDKAEKILNKKVRDLQGSGAAGGLGAGLSFLNTKIQSGIEIILELSDFKDKIKNTDFIFTGEGKIDFQTSQGKVISGILKYSEKIPVIALAGIVESNENLYSQGLVSAFSICNKPMSLEDSIKNASELLTNQTQNICRMIKALQNNYLKK